MICKFCGSKVEKGVPCPNCGAMQHLEDEEQILERQEPQPEALYPDANGAYHWEYQTSSFSNPSTLFYLFRSIFVLGAFIAAVQLMLWAGNGGDILGTLLFVGECTAGLIAFSAVLWAILMLMKGPWLVVKYTMDENKIFYTCERARSKKWKEKHPYQPIYVSETPTKWERPLSEYWKVKKIKAVPRRNLIWVNVYMQKNTVFVPQKYYDFVYAYLTSRCPNAKIKKPGQKNADQ